MSGFAAGVGGKPTGPGAEENGGRRRRWWGVGESCCCLADRGSGNWTPLSRAAAAVHLP